MADVDWNEPMEGETALAAHMLTKVPACLPAHLPARLSVISNEKNHHQLIGGLQMPFFFFKHNFMFWRGHILSAPYQGPNYVHVPKIKLEFTVEYLVVSYYKLYLHDH